MRTSSAMAPDRAARARRACASHAHPHIVPGPLRSSLLPAYPASSSCALDRWRGHRRRSTDDRPRRCTRTTCRAFRHRGRSPLKFLAGRCVTEGASPGPGATTPDPAWCSPPPSPPAGTASWAGAGPRGRPSPNRARPGHPPPGPHRGRRSRTPRRRCASCRPGSRSRAVRSGMPATGRPWGASITDRCNFSPWTSSPTSPKWGMTARPSTRPRPTVSAPPRGSTMGSVRAMAPAPAPATTAPPSQASRRAANTLESFSTDRRCREEPPLRYTKRARRTTSAAPSSSASARPTTISPSTSAPSAPNHSAAAMTSPLGVLVGGGGRQHHDVVAAGRGQQLGVEVAARGPRRRPRRGPAGPAARFLSYRSLWHVLAAPRRPGPPPGWARRPARFSGGRRRRGTRRRQ